MFNQNSLNFDRVPDTGSGSKFSGPGTGTGYNRVLNFGIAPETNLTVFGSVPAESKVVPNPEPGTRFFGSPLMWRISQPSQPQKYTTLNQKA